MVRNFEGKGQFERPSRRWEDIIKKNVKNRAWETGLVIDCDGIGGWPFIHSNNKSATTTKRWLSFIHGTNQGATTKTRGVPSVHELLAIQGRAS